MMMVMLVAGIGLVVGGPAGDRFGFTVKEFSVGSTLIISGIIGVCSGMITDRPVDGGRGN